MAKKLMKGNEAIAEAAVRPSPYAISMPRHVAAARPRRLPTGCPMH